MNFIPEQPTQSTEVPFYDDVTSEGGWQGHSTHKTLDRLKSDVSEALSRLGGMVSSFQRGTFDIEGLKREGFQIRYVIDGAGEGRLNVAALPVKETSRLRKSFEKRTEKSLKMALYMLEIGLSGAWFLQQLSPGYAALIPWMIADGESTVTELWSQQTQMSNLLPPGDADFIEGEFEEA